MGKGISIFFISIFFLLVSCIYSNDRSSPIENDINFFKKSINTTYSIKNLFTHLPKRYDEKNYFSFFMSSVDTTTSFSSLLMYAEKTDNNIDSYIKEIGYKDSVLYRDEKTFIIRNIGFFNSKDSFLYSYNDSLLEKNPIPSFNELDFKLGEEIDYVEQLDTLDENNQLIWKKFKKPNDLIIYIIDAKQGDFWISKKLKLRHASLKNWKNGYTKGFAISKKMGIIIYFVQVW